MIGANSAGQDAPLDASTGNPVPHTMRLDHLDNPRKQLSRRGWSGSRWSPGNAQTKPPPDEMALFIKAWQ
jgi:hypothetical protein